MTRLAGACQAVLMALLTIYLTMPQNTITLVMA